ncbi:MAG: hypothetical protein LBJ89_02075 [Holosporales bacterium]|jgi:chromosome segregation ATPase|nr:hypothetical protein [Holosporales bacterium]
MFKKTSLAKKAGALLVIAFQPSFAQQQTCEIVADVREIIQVMSTDRPRSREDRSDFEFLIVRCGDLTESVVRDEQEKRTLYHLFGESRDRNRELVLQTESCSALLSVLTTRMDAVIRGAHFMQDRLEMQTQTSEDLRQELDTANQIIDVANQRADAAEQELDAVMLRADAAEQELDAVMQRADAAEQERDAVMLRADVAEQERDAVMQELDAAKQELARLQALMG